MTYTPEDIKRAEGIIALAKDRMLQRYPYHVSVLARMPVVARPGIETMGVTFSNPSKAGEDGKVLLLHEPDFVLKTPPAQLVGVLLHEVHHVIFRHLLMSPKDYPHKAALIIAQEVTVNEFIREPLPAGLIELKDYPQLAEMQSTKERYKILEKTLPPPVKLPIHFDDHTWEVEVFPMGGGGPGDGDTGAGNWDKEAILDDLLKEAAREARAPWNLKDALQQHGTEPGEQLDQVAEGGRADPWTILRRYVGQETEIRPVFTRPPRRFPHLLGIVPARTRGAARPKILAALDTSGSISPRMLTQMDANLRAMSREHDILVCECDTKIYRTYRYRRLGLVYGRGGTDLRPPLERRYLTKHKVDLVVYLTDGYGPAPAAAPAVPVIWAIVPGGKVPAPWGRGVQLSD